MTPDGRGLDAAALSAVLASQATALAVKPLSQGRGGLAGG